MDCRCNMSECRWPLLVGGGSVRSRFSCGYYNKLDALIF